MITVTTTLAADDAVAALQQAIESQNMRQVSHINGQANAAKMGKTVPADQILEVFRPDFAIRVWQACKPAGIDIPIRIHIYELDGSTHVACRMPSEIFAPYGSGELMNIGKELDEIFTAIMKAVE